MDKKKNKRKGEKKEALKKEGPITNLNLNRKWCDEMHMKIKMRQK